jgi:hypothetical protein
MKNPNDLYGNQTRYIPACGSCLNKLLHRIPEWKKKEMANNGLKKILPMS